MRDEGQRTVQTREAAAHDRTRRGRQADANSAASRGPGVAVGEALAALQMGSLYRAQLALASGMPSRRASSLRE